MILSSTVTRSARLIATGAILCMAVSSPQGASAGEAGPGPFTGLSGAWTGSGSVTMADGSRESIKCRAVYTVPPSGQTLNQGLRCGSQSYTFDVTSQVVVVSPGKLSGTWSEATRQVTGDVTGSVSPGVIKTLVATLGFSAQLTMATKGARQMVSIQPQGTDVQAVTVEMRRI